MSKSKRNTIDPETIIADFGADVARWFVLSDSPPERDVEWSQSGVEGAWRFAQRVWSVYDALPSRDDIGGAAPAIETISLTDAIELRRASHKAMDAITKSVTSFRFNTAIASIHEWVGTLKRAEAVDSADMVVARIEAARMLAPAVSLFMPHLAEECWERCGEDGLVTTASWPEIEPSLLVDDTILLPVQVNGKKRSEISVPQGAAAQDVEALALEDEKTKTFIADLEVRKVIVVPGRIVNIVAS